mmetsp:Transcript_1122/g.3053  ORF Transcript_1122/g.3053 Transcript_1122/m.3053 type:complete len:312 (-) Transcript_1122:35-970(-)
MAMMLGASTASMRVRTVSTVARRVAPRASLQGARVDKMRQACVAKQPTGARLMGTLGGRRKGASKVSASKDDDTAVKEDKQRRRAHPLDDDTPPSTAAAPNDRDVADDEPVNLVEEFKRGVSFGNSMKERFTTARIDDRGLPIADALICVGASVFVSTVVLALGIPRPSWLVPAPWVPRWRSLPFLVPALSHGTKLAACWIPGALAARAYEAEAYDGSVKEAVSRTVKGGCFAIGILILLTQFSLQLQFAAKGLPPPQLGDGYETDLILNGAASELIADSVFEAVALIGWRIIRCKTDIPPDDPSNTRWYD